MAQDERRQDFVRKLGQFRATLPGDQQKMLDALVMHAESAQPIQDVEGYGWFFGSDGANPQYYSTGITAPGDTTGWWKTYTDTNAFSNTPFG